MPNIRIPVNPGDVYHQITIIREVDKHFTPCGMMHRVFEFRCSCGNKKTATLNHIRSGNVKSCGCLVRTRNGLGRTSICNIWRGVKARCYGKTNAKYYSKRGIKMCTEWRSSFSNFLEWSMANGYKKGLQIDRINNDGNYEPSNCRWVTPKVNANNRRKRK